MRGVVPDFTDRQTGREPVVTACNFESLFTCFIESLRRMAQAFFSMTGLRGRQ